MNRLWLGLTRQSPLAPIPLGIGILHVGDVFQFSNVVGRERMLARAFNKKSLVPRVWAQCRIVAWRGSDVNPCLGIGVARCASRQSHPPVIDFTRFERLAIRTRNGLQNAPNV